MLTLNRKGVSVLAIIILLAISAVIGGIITYMFTIAAFIEVPERTAISITNVYIDKDNATSFKISVLNPSYSTANATITRIAINLKGQSQLYDVTETDPQIGTGITLQRSETLNMTCSEIEKDGVNIAWGEFAGEFAGERITINVFSSDAIAANIQATLPNVKLNVVGTDFDPKFSFGKFNITVTNPDSEINLTVNKIMISENELKENETLPELPKTIAINETVQFMCNADWHALGNTTLKIYTQEGYIFSKDLALQTVDAEIRKLTFDENNTDYFNVTVSNLPESSNYANVTKIAVMLENETTIENDYPSVGIAPNSTFTFMFSWSWKEYRGKNVFVTVYFSQDFETGTFVAETLDPVIVNVLNEEEVFDLKDVNHFNITLQNHPSSLESINITQIVVKTLNGATEIINGTDSDPQLPYGPIQPGQAVSFYCTITNWAAHAGKNLTLTVYAVTSSTQYTFDFVFTLPGAELNVTSVLHTTVSSTRYLNVTVENSGYSLKNLAISNVTISIQNQNVTLEQTFSEDQIVIRPGETAVLQIAFNWEPYVGQNITVTVSAEEGVSAAWQGNDW